MGMLVRAVVGRSPNVGILSSRRLASKRTFFASSTDFTRLLDEAEVHRIPQDDGSTQYVMAASGTDADMVKKVPQLHLARLFVLDKTLFGAKVVNRTLGSPSVVCEKLIDAALKDAGAGAQARSTLHGLSDWVLKGIKEKEGIDAKLKDAEIKALEAIAAGELDEKVYNVGKEGWEKLAREYIEKGNGGEAMMYVSKGGKLVAVEHLADTSEFSNTSGGAMAVFSF
jgi:hypothetical protein